MTGPNRRGRPCKDPPWLKEAAEMCARGTPLRKALWRLGRYSFSERELKNLYRLKLFRVYYETARLEYFREWGRLPRRSRTRPIDRILAGISATNLEF
jgi:hypothetical protein